MADIYFSWFGLWAPYSDYCMVCFFRKVFLKSDTAVALRKSLSKSSMHNTWIFINIYNEHFSKLMWLSAKSQHVLEVLNITRQCKFRFLDINMHFIEQNIHEVLWVSSNEDHQRLVINCISICGFCDSSLWLENRCMLSVTSCWPNIMICSAFAEKLFWNQTLWLD